MNPERFSFIIVHDLLGWSADRIARRLTAEIEPVAAGEVQTLMDSPLYLAERSEILDAFRRHSIRTAADEIAVAAHDCVVFLRSIIGNYAIKPHLQVKVAMDFLDRVPQTSKTLRQFINNEAESPITEEQLERLHSQLYVDPRVNGALAEPSDEEEYRKSLKHALDVGK